MSPQTLPILLLIALAGVAAAVVLLYVLYKKVSELKDVQKNDAMAQMMNQNLQAMHERLDKAAHYIGALGQELRTMQGIGKHIDELRSVFFSAKLRGNFGERMLYDMLENNFPRDHFQTQYKFKDGQVVDAILKTKDGLVPVDSKFPIDNFRKMLAAENDDQRAFERNEFQKAVRKHINDVAKKYVLPGEGTVDFAIMYVPSEAVFYEIVSTNDEMTDLAQRSRVLMASPNTLSYFLHILRMGHERIRIEENVQKVWGLLAGIHQETMKFGQNLDIMARHVTNAKSNMDTIMAEYGKLAGKIDQIRRLQ